jgi:hypothetical protein
MSYPYNTKDVMKAIKAGYKRYIGCESGWQAHRVHKCAQTCWYCLQLRRSNVNSGKP